MQWLNKKLDLKKDLTNTTFTQKKRSPELQQEVDQLLDQLKTILNNPITNHLPPASTKEHNLHPFFGEQTSQSLEIQKTKTEKNEKTTTEKNVKTKTEKNEIKKESHSQQSLESVSYQLPDSLLQENQNNNSLSSTEHSR